MKSLDDAWAWYTASKENVKRLAHLAKYWEDLPWDTGEEWIVRIGRDNVLNGLQASDLASHAKLVGDELDDLAVLVLFSVFEAVIRDQVSSQLRPEVDQLRHTALISAGKDVLKDVSEGSFFRVLEPFKSDKTHDLIEQVHQIRKYRN